MDSIIDQLKEVLSPVKEVAANLKRKTRAGELAGPCPKCDGDDRFYVRPDGSFACRQCNPKGGDVVDFHTWLEGTDIKGLATKYLNDHQTTKRKRAKVIPENFVCEYPYTDEQGAELFRVQRFEEAGCKKTFRQGHYDEDGKWVGNIHGVRRVLYRLPEVQAATHVIFVEGEKDADRLVALGFRATTSPMGASSWNKEHYAAFLKDKNIAIISDNDQPGRKHADNVAADLKSVADSVRIVNLPDLPEQGDVSDWFDAGGTEEELKEIIKAAPMVEQQGAIDPLAILRGYEVSDDYVNGLGREEFLYPNFIIKNHIIVIIAESGGGKTTLLFFTVAPELSKNGLIVWYVDSDSPASDHKRMKQFAKNNGINFLIPDVNEGKSIQSLMGDIETLADSHTNLNNYVFFFDTLKKFIDLMSKRSSKDFFVLMRKLTKLGATVVLPGHANKHRDVNGNLVFEGVGDVKSDTDELIYFEKTKRQDGTLDVTTVVDTDRGAKVRGLFQPFSFNVNIDRTVTFYDNPLDIVDRSGSGEQKATDEEILDTAAEYLAKLTEPINQKRLVDYTADMVQGEAGEKRVRKVIVQHSSMKGEPWVSGKRFVYEIGDHNTHLYSLPEKEPSQGELF